MIISCSPSWTAVYSFILIRSLALVYQSHCSATSAHSISSCIQKSTNLSRDVMTYRNCRQLHWKILWNHNFLAQTSISFAGREQRISTTVLIFNHNLLMCASLQPAPSVSPLFQHCRHCLLSLPLSSLSLCFFTQSAVCLQCLKSNLPRQAVWVQRLLSID